MLKFLEGLLGGYFEASIWAAPLAGERNMGKKTKVGISIAIILLIAGYFGLRAYAAHVAEKNINRTIGKVDGFVDMDYQKVDVGLFGLNTHIKNVRLAQPGRPKTVKIDDIVIRRFDRQGRIPASLHVRFKGINVDLDQMGKDAAALRQMGYSHIKADTELDYTYDPAQQTLAINKFQTGAAGLGDITMTCQIANMDLNPANLPVLLFTFPDILLNQAKLTYRDHSFVKRFLKLAAQKKGQAYDAFMRDLNATLDNEIAGQSDPFLKQAMTSFKQFLNNPDAITLSISPDEPVSIGRLQNVKGRDELIKLLNAKAYVN